MHCIDDGNDDANKKNERTNERCRISFSPSGFPSISHRRIRNGRKKSDIEQFIDYSESIQVFRFELNRVKKIYPNNGWMEQKFCCEIYNTRPGIFLVLSILHAAGMEMIQATDYQIFMFLFGNIWQIDVHFAGNQNSENFSFRYVVLVGGQKSTLNLLQTAIGCRMSKMQATTNFLIESKLFAKNIRIKMRFVYSPQFCVTANGKKWIYRKKK